jgi:perosamine synthetase
MTWNHSQPDWQIPYGHQWITDDDIRDVLDVLRSDWITQGPRIDAFEGDLATYSGAKYVSVLSNGTLALQAAVHAIGIEPGDEVIVPAVTFVATSNCVFHNSGIPVIADVDPCTGLIDVDDLERRITPRTRAIIPMHLAGASCDMEWIREVARKNDLQVIEDACHALGGDYRGRKICGCAYSDMAVTSFHPVKSITTGEGGAVFCNDEKLTERVRSYRNHGITKDPRRLAEDHGAWYYEMQELGTNARLTDFQCALGQAQLKRLDQFIARRREIAAYYNEHFADLPGLSLPIGGDESAWHLYIIQIEPMILGADRLEVFNDLKKRGLGVNVHYIPLHYHPYYQKRLGVYPGDFPAAESYYQHSITIPLYPSMSDQDVERVVDAVGSVIEALYRTRLFSVMDVTPSAVKADSL